MPFCLQPVEMSGWPQLSLLIPNHNRGCTILRAYCRGAPHLASEMWDQIRAQAGGAPFSSPSLPTTEGAPSFASFAKGGIPQRPTKFVRSTNPPAQTNHRPYHRTVENQVKQKHQHRRQRRQPREASTADLLQLALASPHRLRASLFPRSLLPQPDNHPAQAAGHSPPPTDRGNSISICIHENRYPGP